MNDLMTPRSDAKPVLDEIRQKLDELAEEEGIYLFMLALSPGNIHFQTKLKACRIDRDRLIESVW